MMLRLYVAMLVGLPAVQDLPPLPPPPGPYVQAPVAQSQEPGVRLVDYVRDAVVPVRVPLNRQLTIEFAEGERIENVALGDSQGWQVAASARGDHLFVKPQGTAPTNMTVVTSSRTYLFELSPDSGGYEAQVYTLRFLLPPGEMPPPRAARTSPPVGAIAYRLTGANALRPSVIHDDGVHTYLEWPEDVSMPAVFGIDETGGEVLVDGYVRGGIYTLDRVYDRLVFRMGKLRARAQRQTGAEPQ
jgi:type IV secretion system protein VirB9